MIDLRELEGSPHRRFNPLTGDWVLVSPQRNERPWQGQTEAPEREERPQYDPNCYLCPGNSRAGGVRNPHYESTFVFDNDFAALKMDTAPAALDAEQRGLIAAQSERGLCRVVCFSPRHDLTLSDMPVDAIHRVVDAWAEQYSYLGVDPRINHVQIFENRGLMMGCSNPHPHGQIWANETLPNEARKELSAFERHRQAYSSCLLCDYLRLERQAERRIVCQNDEFTVLVPFWATWPFEVLLLSQEHLADIVALDEKQRTALADILKRITSRYDNLFHVPFPYTMGFHQRPTDGRDYPAWHLHAHFYPPLLRSATVRKFMVGYEMLCSPQRDISPESAAEALRAAREAND